MKYDICVFGGCSLDRFFYQNTDGTYNDTPSISLPGGKGSNQAVAASRAGAKVTIISKLGKDKIGEEIINNLAYNRVDISNIDVIESLNNDCSNIYVNITDKDNDIKRFSGAIESFSEDMIEKHKDVILSSNIIVSQFKAPKPVLEKLIDFCYKHNKMFILTPCRPNRLVISDPKNKELLDKVSLITANQQECETIFETTDIESCVKQYPNKLIVTLGSQGLMYYNGSRIIHMPAIKPDNILDTTGAGDTLNGNLAYLLSQGIDLQHALRKAMYASTMKLQKKGAQAGMPYKEELENFISSSRVSSNKYHKELTLILENIRKCYMQQNKIEIFEKKDKSFVTNMDLHIENFLINLIKKHFPNDNFLTEETNSTNELKDRTWIIDPIDGTNHFIKNTGLYCTQLAFYDKGSTMFSVIYKPQTDELYFAVKNGGAYVNNNKILPPKQIPLKMALVEFCGTIARNFDDKLSILSKMINKETNELKVLNFLYIYVCSIAFTNLASLKTDGLIISSKKPWDVMPGDLLCKEAGMNVYNLDFKSNLKLYTYLDNLKDLLLKV